jgi:hypothetical protein
MKRTVRLSSARRRRILERDHYLCRYCNERADQVDHIIPYTWSIRNEDSNLVACCGRCNLVAGNKVFDSFDQKRDYILARRRQKRDQIVADAPVKTHQPEAKPKRKPKRKSEAKPKKRKHTLRYLLNRADALIDKFRRTGHL